MTARQVPYMQLLGEIWDATPEELLQISALVNQPIEIDAILNIVLDPFSDSEFSKFEPDPEIVDLKDQILKNLANHPQALEWAAWREVGAGRAIIEVTQAMSDIDAFQRILDDERFTERARYSGSLGDDLRKAQRIAVERILELDPSRAKEFFNDYRSHDIAARYIDDEEFIAEHLRSEIGRYNVDLHAINNFAQRYHDHPVIAPLIFEVCATAYMSRDQPNPFKTLADKTTKVSVARLFANGVDTIDYRGNPAHCWAPDEPTNRVAARFARKKSVAAAFLRNNKGVGQVAQFTDSEELVERLVKIVRRPVPQSECDRQIQRSAAWGLAGREGLTDDPKLAEGIMRVGDAETHGRLAHSTNNLKTLVELARVGLGDSGRVVEGRTYREPTLFAIYSAVSVIRDQRKQISESQHGLDELAQRTAGWAISNDGERLASMARGKGPIADVARNRLNQFALGFETLSKGPALAL